MGYSKTPRPPDFTNCDALARSVLLERASVLLQSPNPNEASGAGRVSVHNGSTRLMVLPHLRTKTRAVHPSTLCVWEEKKTPIPPTCHNGNGSERAFVGRSDPHLDRTSICVSQTVPSTTGRIYIYIFFQSLAFKKVVCDSASRLQRSSTNGQRMGGCVCVTLARTCRYSSDKQLLTDRKLGKWMGGWVDGRENFAMVH